MITSPLKPGKTKTKQPKSSNKVLAIDFDGVVHDKANPIEGRRMGPPIDGAFTALHKLKASGHTIFIHTTMANTPAGKIVVEKWLEYYQMPYDLVFPKPQADYYIDDKALEFKGDWSEVMDKLTKKGI